MNNSVGMRFVGCAALAALFVLLPRFTHAGSDIRLGLVGDSLTDEYTETDFPYALNWVQQAVMFRAVDCGPTAAQASQPGGTWGEPRRTQYEYNWARYGATSSTMLADGQHTGVASQIVPKDLTHVLIAIGANDFSPALGIAYFAIYWNLWSNAQKQTFINNIASRIETALDAVLAHETNVILANVPDYGVTPAVRAVFPNAIRRQNVTNVVNQLNTMIEDIAAEREIVLINIASLTTAIFGTNFKLNEILTLGNVPIYLWQSDTNTNTNPQAAFVHDSAHPHTTLQGLFANVILEAMNITAAQPITPFAELELLAHAGLRYGGADTLASQLGAFADYVLDFSPQQHTPGDLNQDGAIDVQDLLILLGAWGPCTDVNNCPADINLDGNVDVQDLLVLLGNWG
ncbi:MAG TPA: SGNH/GDSL hydrolase family protein [Phycisphaerales bacterium]|nr:SGNH/GDSL hydrolase family protein [Phycisphaerales bacterium]HRQ75830.1 SGNH/GDSL hydrolase family protein [Phycisphaerales bacterium]